MRNILLFILIGASLILGASTLTRGHEWGDDFASYIMQAGSILNGTTDQFVVHNAFTIFESSNQIGPVAYPWGYPLILVPFYAAKGVHPLTLKLPGLLFYAGFLVCLYILMERRLGRRESLLVVALFAFSPLLVRFLDQILSDIPFLFFSTLALLLMASGEKLQARGTLLGCVIAGAFFIRTPGILLLLSFFALEAWKAWQNRNDPDALKRIAKKVLIVAGSFGALWILYALLFPGGGESYLAQYQDFKIETVLRYSQSYFKVFGLFFGQNTGWQILYYLLFIFFLVGAWQRRKQDLLFIVFFFLWILLLITWPSWQGPRFIFPILPIFIYFIFQGMEAALGKLPDQYAGAGRWVMYGFWMIVIVSFLYTSSARAYGNLQNDRGINGPFDSYSKEVYSYIKEETPADSVIVFFKPRAMRLMTKRDSLLSTDCAGILKGDYLVLSRKVGRNQQIPPEEIDACDLPLNEVLKNNRFVVYEIQKQ